MFFSRLIRETEGATAVMTAISILTAVGSMSLAIDLGHLYVVHSELQRAADAGALAGAMGLLNIPPGTTGPVTLSLDCTRATTTAKTVVRANSADGGNLDIHDSDITFGKWDPTAKVFNPIGCVNPNLVNAVRVVTRKDSTTHGNGPVLLNFIGIMPGQTGSRDLTATAIGLIGNVGNGGTRTFPLAVDEDKVPPYNTPFRINFNPTPGDDGCWHNYKDGKSSASDLRKYVNGTKPAPELEVGDQINVKEGVADSVLQEMEKLSLPYDALVPIIPANCAHNGTQPVLGFATLRVTEVKNEGDEKYVEGQIVPDYVAPGTQPGGPNYGTISPYAKVVQ